MVGGTRSGKSRHAQSLALERSEAPVYVATSRIWDDDHRRRIERHRRERGSEWRTLEVDTQLAEAPIEGQVAVVDCVTLWLSSLFADWQGDVERCLSFATQQIDALAERPGEIIFVSNELGQGVHAPTELGRKFADLQGLVNQHLARRAERVVWMVAGIGVVIKPAPGL